MRYIALLIVSSVLVLQQINALSVLPTCESMCPVYIQAPPPVCGDGKQYYDECRAKCAGAKVITPGPCPTKKPPCDCPKIYLPVCGDGVTYGNKCFAVCAGASVITPGPCCPVGPCPRCTNEYKPVCADGVTYNNLCLTMCICPKPKKIVPGACYKGR